MSFFRLLDSGFRPDYDPGHWAVSAVSPPAKTAGVYHNRDITSDTLTEDHRWVAGGPQYRGPLPRDPWWPDSVSRQPIPVFLSTTTPRGGAYSWDDAGFSTLDNRPARETRAPQFARVLSSFLPWPLWCGRPARKEPKRITKIVVPSTFSTPS